MASPAQKTSVVLVPGAWHSPEAFSPLSSLLESAGYTVVGVHLKSVGADPPLEDFKPDVEVIRSAIQGEIDRDGGRDVVVLMHSYGGFPGGEAVKDLDKMSVRKGGGGSVGGVTALIYCTAFAPARGTSLMDALQGNPLPWFRVSEDEKTVNPATPGEIFYNDIPKSEHDKLISQLAPQSYKTFSSKSTYEPWRDFPCTYIYCTGDNAIPVEAQKGMVEAAKSKWTEVTLEGASHSPFISQPDQVAKAVREAAGEVV